MGEFDRSRELEPSYTPTLHIISNETDVTPAETAEEVYVKTCTVIYGVAKAHGLDPARFLSTEQIEIAQQIADSDLLDGD